MRVKKNKTETIYFKNFVSRDCIIKFSTGNSTDPVNMAKELVQFMNREDIKQEYGDKIYLLLDTDVNQNKQKQIDEAFKICNANGIEVILSNPTFEIWYKLHFEYTTKYFRSSKQVKDEIKLKIKDYSESMNIYPFIKSNVQIAIVNAKKLEEYHRANGRNTNSEECNPNTYVYKIVEELLERTSFT